MNPKKASSAQVPVVYDPRVSNSLVGHLASAVNGSVEFRIEKGTAAFDGVGSILGYIAIVEARNLFLPAPSDGAVIRAFDVSPAGAVFMPPLTLSVSYPEGFKPGAGDYLAWWNGGRWVELPSVVNTADAAVTAKVRHFTRFAIIDRYGEVAAPTLPQTELGVTELMVTPEGSGSPHLVIVSVLVKNPETFNAVGTVTLTLNEKLLMSQDVALPGQGERKLVFTVAPDGPGRHRISVNQVGETFVVSQ